MAKKTVFIFITIVLVFSLTSRSQAGDKYEKCYRFNNVNVPYGYYRHHLRQAGYGERIKLKSKEEAVLLVKEFYDPMNVNIVPVAENRRFYKMEILDENKNILDIVIVDKLSGRIRSIY